MKILLICGDSGVGKTTIAERLCNLYPNFFYLIRSYTTRPRRNIRESDHIFINKWQMKALKLQCDVLASTNINNYCYCATKEQCCEKLVNVYIIDEEGRKEISKRKDCDICTIFIKRDNVEDDVLDAIRLNRKISLPKLDQVNQIFINHDNINNTVENIKNFVEEFYV